VRLVNVYGARGQLSKLLEQAEAGEEIVVARNGKPIGRLVPSAPQAASSGAGAER
jgi:prevent-host-death family protein